MVLLEFDLFKKVVTSRFTSVKVMFNEYEAKMNSVLWTRYTSQEPFCFKVEKLLHAIMSRQGAHTERKRRQKNQGTVYMVQFFSCLVYGKV